MLGRGKKEVIIGPTTSRLQRGVWKRRLHLGIAIAIGCALFVWAFRHDALESHRRIARLDMEQIRSAARYFRQDFGRCPHDVDELAHPPAGRVPYLSIEPRDPWGRAYYMQCPSRWTDDDVDVATPGPDGSWLGGDDMSTDL